MFWYDGPGPTYGQNKFNFGNGDILIDNYLNNLNDAKFTVTNTYDYNAGFISSTSRDANTVLWVDHSNYKWSPGTHSFLGTYNSKLSGIFNHISKGAGGNAATVNCGFDNLLDTALADLNIGIRSKILIEKSYGLSIPRLSFTTNIGGQFITNVAYNNPYNYGIDVQSTADINNPLPINNTGVNIGVNNALNVNGIYCNSFNGTSTNNGIEIHSTVTPGNNSLAGSIFGGKYFVYGARTENTGVYSEIDNSGSSLVNSSNYGFKTKLTGNDYNQQGITGFYGDISNNQNSGSVAGADLQVRNNYGTSVNYGVNINVNSNHYNYSTAAQQNNYGIFSQVINNPYTHHNIACYGLAHNDSATLNVGVYGEAGGSGQHVVNPYNGNIGVWGKVSTFGAWTLPPPAIPALQTEVAGYFNGDVVITGTILNPSDIFLKDSIKPLQGVLSKLMNIKPRSYFFKTKEFESMSLSWRLQFGLIAPEVYAEFPNLVETVVNPSILDSSGKVKFPELKYEAINYQGFIPLLIQGEKELNNTNDSLKIANNDLKKSNESLKNQMNTQNKRIDSLQNIITGIESRLENLSFLINDCCESKNLKKSEGEGNDINIIEKTNSTFDPDKTTFLDQNNPNPFKSITTFGYKIGNSGFVELEITDQLGKIIDKLVKSNMQSGYYSIEWNSKNTPAGIYFYSLKVNGLMLVKKAIKIN